MLLLASFTCLDACCCHGLRLPVFNKETTYLLTYLYLLSILCQISLPWQRGLIARPQQPLLGAKILMIFPIQIEL